jgi:hypothetical protein
MTKSKSQVLKEEYTKLWDIDGKSYERIWSWFEPHQQNEIRRGE